MSVSEAACVQYLELLCAFHCQDAESLYPDEQLALPKKEEEKKYVSSFMNVKSLTGTCLGYTCKHLLLVLMLSVMWSVIIC